ncbi:MAG: hypothetical protein OEL84_11375 [Nitrosopumilus sp.]|nr:hypothetical protein [Nitrosopumilus sp.]
MEPIRKEMFRIIDFDTHDNIEEILDEIQRTNMSKFLKIISGHEHTLFLWADKDLRTSALLY